MTYREFNRWIDDRMCDKRWSPNVAMHLINIRYKVMSNSWWSREKEFQKFNKEYGIEELIKEQDKRRRGFEE